MMLHKKTKYILLAILACTLTGCPEGAMSEGTTTDACDNHYMGSTWTTTDCNGRQMTLKFTSCEIWDAHVDTLAYCGYYVGRNDTITGGVSGSHSELCCLTSDSIWRGVVNADGQLVIGDCTFTQE